MNTILEAPSSALRQLAGNILTPKGWLQGTLRFSDRVESVEGRQVPAPDARMPLILPGFIDLHVHGGGGADIMRGREAVATTARMHARHGTTCLLATTVSADLAELEHVFAEIAPAIRERLPGSARVLGIHLEGPYINKGKLGAQPEVTRAGSLDEVLALHAIAPIRVLTLAPELEGHLEFIRGLKAQGIAPQIGHTLGSYEACAEALAAGASGFTHLFNAMTPLHHRNPGAVGAALAHADFAELIMDLLHVHPGAIRAALRAIPRLYCVTDATAGAGMPDGTYSLGSQTLTKCGGGVRLADGTLAGSTLTMDEALRNLVSLGLPLEDASRRVSTYPAEFLSLADRGRIACGCWADFAVMDTELGLLEVIVEGDSVELADA